MEGVRERGRPTTRVPCEGYGQRLHDAIYEKGFTINGFAIAIGASKPALYSWMYGERIPNLYRVQDMCEVLGVSADWLIFGKEK